MNLNIFPDFLHKSEEPAGTEEEDDELKIVTIYTICARAHTALHVVISFHPPIKLN